MIAGERWVAGWFMGRFFGRWVAGIGHLDRADGRSLGGRNLLRAVGGRRSAGRQVVRQCRVGNGFGVLEKVPVHGVVVGFGPPGPGPARAGQDMGRASGRSCGAMTSASWPLPSMASRGGLRIARAGQSTAGRRQIIWGNDFGLMAAAVHGVAWRAPARPARPSMAGRSARHAAVPRKQRASPRIMSG